MKTELVKGFKDYVDEDARKRSEIKKILVETFERFGFEPAETPVVEYESFVKGDNEKDEAVSDVFKLTDRGKRKLALRYEFTFQLKRLMQNKKLPFKRYQIGPVFRDEPVSANRFRQFTQCDVDTIGSTTKDEAEVLAIANELLTRLGINPIIMVNSRKLLNEILDEAKVEEKDKEQVLREIDKFDKLPEEEIKNNLKKFNAEKIIDWLKQGEEFFNKFESYKEIISLMEYCKLYGFKILFSPTVIRGLSYYNGTVFEIKAEGIKETITAGGSYKFEGIQSTGISFGLDRLYNLAKIKYDEPKVLIVSLDEDKMAINVAQQLREKGRNVTIYYGKPSKGMAYANSKNMDQIIFVGAKEVKEKKVKVKDLETGKEKIIVMKKVTKKNVIVSRKKN